MDTEEKALLMAAGELPLGGHQINYREIENMVGVGVAHGVKLDDMWIGINSAYFKGAHCE